MCGDYFTKNKGIMLLWLVATIVFIIKYIGYVNLNLENNILENLIFDIILVSLLILSYTLYGRKSANFERLVSTIINNIPYPIYYKKYSGEYIECNKAFESLVKKSRKDIIKKKIEQIVESEVLSEWQRLGTDLTNNPGMQVYELSTDLFTEDTRDYIIKKDIVYTGKNKISGVIGVVFDITEMKKISSELVEVVKQEKKKNDFFSNISHEIRTPINVILTTLQVIEQSGEFEEKYLKMLKENGYRLLRLVNNLIDMTKIEAGYYNLNLGNYNIVNVIEEISISVVEYAKANGIALLFDTDVEEKIIACDPEKIERIMLNLLSNAIKFTPNGGKIEVVIKDEGTHILISVKDTGAGIEKQKITTIFQRFVQVNSSLVKQKEGSGIGLALSKSLVELHNGKIWAESEVGIGTTLFVRLENKELVGIKESELETNMKNINIEFSNIHK
ncbi:MAG TPA: hypothetical protein DCP90_06130 [Clostridiales bacterium]|nr:MAG: hypothetical protein A2Y22_09170 [Clostridiales bacterium GWD2_32_59]HAN10172.1 hypothetical protein [Clostridiales bacterium]